MHVSEYLGIMVRHADGRILRSRVNLSVTQDMVDFVVLLQSLGDPQIIGLRVEWDAECPDPTCPACTDRSN